MKSKFEEFNDGIIHVYSVDDNDKLVSKIENDLRFGEENVSITRHYAAEAAGEKCERVIHVQLQNTFKAHDVVVINDEQYDVEKIDNFKDNLPPISKLSLTLLNMHRKKEFA